MSTQLQTVEAGLPASPESGEAALMGLIEKVSLDPNMSVDKLEKLLDLKERYDQNQARLEFEAAMAKVQEQMPLVVADADNTQTGSRYAKLCSIVHALSPVYTREGFSVSFTTDECPIAALNEKGWLRYMAQLSHSAGFSKSYHVDLPLDEAGMAGKPNKTKMHAAKSSITYSKTILMGMMFNFATSLTDVEDDGNAAGGVLIPHISQEEAATIRDHIASLGKHWKAADEKKFLAYLCAPSIDEIQADRYRAALKALAAKRKKVES